MSMFVRSRVVACNSEAFGCIRKVAWCRLLPERHLRPCDAGQGLTADVQHVQHGYQTRRPANGRRLALPLPHGRGRGKVGGFLRRCGQEPVLTRVVTLHSA